MRRKGSPRLFVTISDDKGEFKIAYWPARRVVTNERSITIYFHANKQVTYSLSGHSIMVETEMWEGALPTS